MNTFDPDPSSQLPVQLKSLDGTLPENATELGEGTFRCEPEDALEHIIRGRAELTDHQAHPPFHILRKLSSVLEDLDQIWSDQMWPEWNTPKRLQKFQNAAIPGGVRVTFVEGEQLNWIEGVTGLQDNFADFIIIAEVSFLSILSQVTSCWEYQKSRSEEYIESVILTEEKMVKNGLVGARRKAGRMSLVSTGKRYRYLKVGQEWVKFFVEMEKLQTKLGQVLDECLRAGRVIAVDEKPNGATMVPPSEWQDKNLTKQSDKNLVFVLSRDFPREWFHSLEDLPAVKAIATRWLLKAEKKLDERGRRASEDDYENIMMRKFYITLNATKDVWKHADRIHKGASGYIPDAIRATKADLLEIERDN